MVLSRGLRDEVKTAFWGRAVDRQVVGLARGLAHHPTPACLQQLPTPSSAVRICSTLDRHTAVTEGHEQRESGFRFYFGFYSIPRATTLRTDGHGAVNIGKAQSKPHSELRVSDPQASNHRWLFHRGTSRWSLRISGLLNLDGRQIGRLTGGG